MSIFAVDKLIGQARKLASDYRKTMGKPLAGISGEIAEYDAVNLLGLELCQPKVSGYDAIGKGDRDGKRIQIKARVVVDGKLSGQRIGQLKFDQDWDMVVLVLMDENYEAYEIYQASHDAILEAMQGKDSKRNKRGAMSVAKFRIIGQRAWARQDAAEEAPVDEDVTDNKASV